MKNSTRIICIIIAIILVVTFFFIGRSNGKKKGEELGYMNGIEQGFSNGFNEAKLAYEAELDRITEQYEALLTKDAISSEFYYAEAYILKQTETTDNFIEVIWCIDEGGSQCFITYESEPLDESTPFLLTMYTNGTEDILDDKVVVIWKGL